MMDAIARVEAGKRDAGHEPEGDRKMWVCFIDGSSRCSGKGWVDGWMRRIQMHHRTDGLNRKLQAITRTKLLQLDRGRC